MALDPVTLSFAFTTGVLTFFSPCAVGLIPAYVGYFTGLADEHGTERSTREAALAGARFGGAAALGILVLFSLGGALIYVLRSRFSLASTTLLTTVEALGLAVGVGLVVLGVLMLAARAPSITLPVRAPRERTPLSMMAFGVVFAVASMGCTLPLFFAAVLQPALQDALSGLTAFVAFGAGIASLMFGVAVAMSVAEETARARLVQVMPYVRPVSGVVIVLAGLYVVYYYLTLP